MKTSLITWSIICCMASSFLGVQACFRGIMMNHQTAHQTDHTSEPQRNWSMFIDQQEWPSYIPLSKEEEWPEVRALAGCKTHSAIFTTFHHKGLHESSQAGRDTCHGGVVIVYCAAIPFWRHMQTLVACLRS